MKIEYDDEQFFQQYAQMERSREGLAGAGEWHQLRKLFPDVRGKCVLDLGCGYGWHCRYAADQGAEQVLGIDISARMIGEAENRNQGDRITYRVCGLEEYEYPEERWDCVVSNLALHYVEDLENVYGKVYRTLRSGGTFLFNIEHPVFTAGAGQEWIRDEEGKALFWPVDDYFYPGERRTHFLGCEVIKQHHTITQILNGLLQTGFEIKAVEEAYPSEEMRVIPEMKDEMRRPMMLLVKAGKPGKLEKPPQPDASRQL
ncbi:MAG TPA: class I SAM-dependent methyltransferase [Candidatus Mediterraneibacter tabaqchaliae]|uniref:Class I SAM-dependent methyltransferase n=1 Tax=Candidatus Mediterraneibacter tabaqchaliae TaxID=2838689 RepID=A0A9D2U2M1_9FIRM|nr:class I SAM-dependent methyltransferase [Candidatus Mediterraneibacter tabaqchaliae]